MAAKGSKGAVIAAIIGNSLVMIAKFGAFIFTFSAAMLSEAIHTLADLMNQILLLVGIVRSEKSPDDRYQYGYKAERYVWALISAVGIFFLGCGVTIYHGIQSLLHPHELEYVGWAIGVLIFSFVIEFYVLVVAVRSVKKDAGAEPFFKFLWNDADPAAVAVVLEDSAACLGVLIAIAALILHLVTGFLFWDAIASITIGILLGAIAIWLVAHNSQLLVGSSIPQRLRDQIHHIIDGNPAVEEIVDLKTRVLDTETYRIKADVVFDGEALAEKLADKLPAAYAGIGSFDDFRKFSKEYADDVVKLLANEIDSIEKRIAAKVPQAKHMDIEAE